MTICIKPIRNALVRVVGASKHIISIYPDAVPGNQSTLLRCEAVICLQAAFAGETAASCKPSLSLASPAVTLGTRQRNASEHVRPQKVRDAALDAVCDTDAVEDVRAEEATV